MKLMEKMIDHPFASVIVVGILVDGVSILAHNFALIFKK